MEEQNQHKKQAMDIYNVFRFALLSQQIYSEYLTKQCALHAVDEKIKTVQLQRDLYASITQWKEGINSGDVGQAMRDCCNDHIKELGFLKDAINEL